MAHIVKLLDDLEFRTPAEFDGRSKGYATDAVVNEPGGGVQMGFRVSRLDAGGAVEAHVQSFEESIYVMEGSLVLDTVEGSTEMVAGDYALVPVGMTHGLRNISDAPASFAEMQAPLPRERFGYDTQFPGGATLEAGTPRPVDVRDPRTRSFGHIDAESMDPAATTTPPRG